MPFYLLREVNESQFLFLLNTNGFIFYRIFTSNAGKVHGWLIFVRFLVNFHFSVVKIIGGN